MTNAITLDLILNGKVADAGARRHAEIAYEQGIQVRVPALGVDDLDDYFRGAGQVQKELDRLSIRQLAEFLRAVGMAWMSDASPWRRFALEHAPAITGYHRDMLGSDYFLLGEFLSTPSSLYDQVRAELGDELIHDEWIPVQASYIRAFGLGVAVHILVGNLPLAGLYSLVRGVLSRNANLAKLPTRDPISAYAFVRSMIDVDPEHPVSRSMSLAYWEHGSPVGAAALQRADVGIVWGGQQTIAEIGRQAGGTPLVLFGPKRSLTVIDLDQAEPGKAALRLAFDMGFYDQEACFSSQHAFVRGDAEAFMAALAEAVERFGTAMPLVTTNRDIVAHRSSSLLEARYHGWRVVEAGDAAIVLLPKGVRPFEHPLTRTMYLHPIDDVGDVTGHLDRDTQTLGVYPWELTHGYRDEWARAGVGRIVELGMSRHPRQGFTHDGMRWLNQLVRVVSVERPSAQLYRYNTVTGDGLEQWLFERPLAGQ